MDEVNIYTYQSVKGGKANKGAYVYILETIKNGEPKTITGERKLIKPTTENAAELITLNSALSRIKKKCKITIFTDNAYVASAINNHWVEQWELNGWKNTKGRVISDKEEWQKLLICLGANDISVIKNIEPHSYYNWMMQEAETVERDTKDTGEEKTIQGLAEDSTRPNKQKGYSSDSQGTSENPKQERIRHQINATKLINNFRTLDKPIKDYHKQDLQKMQQCAENLSAELRLYMEFREKEEKES